MKMGSTQALGLPFKCKKYIVLVWDMSHVNNYSIHLINFKVNHVCMRHNLLSNLDYHVHIYIVQQVDNVSVTDLMYCIDYPNNKN